MSTSLADDSFGGRHLRRGEKTADVQDFLEMELAGLEPATSWVRFKWPIGLLSTGRGFVVGGRPDGNPRRREERVLDSESDSKRETAP